MRDFQDTFATRKRSFISALSICMTVPLKLEFYTILSSATNVYKQKQPLVGVVQENVCVGVSF